jgi:hypothetical protein
VKLTTYEVTSTTYEVTSTTYEVTAFTYEVTSTTYEVTAFTYEVTSTTYEVAWTTYEVTSLTYEVTSLTYEVVTTTCETVADSIPLGPSLQRPAATWCLGGVLTSPTLAKPGPEGPNERPLATPTNRDLLTRVRMVADAKKRPQM